MTSGPQDWPSADQSITNDPDPIVEEQRDVAAERRARRLYRQLLRDAPNWNIVERAHAPFIHRQKGRTRTFKPKGRPPSLNDFEAFAPPPRSWDWRPRIQMARPLDQRGCNCCTAFAMASTMTDLATIQYGRPRAPLSPAHLHWCIGHASCGDALDPMALANLAMHQSVALHEPGDYPYKAADCAKAKGVGRLGSATYVYTPDEAYRALQRGPILAIRRLLDELRWWKHLSAFHGRQDRGAFG